MDTNSDQEMPLDGCAFSYSPRTRRKGTRESFHPYRRPTECQSQTEFAQKLSTRGSSRPQQSSVDVSDSLSQDAEGETDDEVDGAYDVDESPSHSSSISLDAPTHPHQIPGPTVSSYSAYSTQLATVYTLVKSAPRREPITIELPQPSILPSLEIASTQPSLTTSRKRRRKAIELVPTTLYNTFWIWTFVRLVMEMRRREGGLEALTMSTTPGVFEKTMNQKHFCNPYRVLDATTQYILKKVIGEGSSKLEEVVFRVILFDIFTKPATWEKLCENLGGIPKWEGGRGMQGLGQANGKAKSRSVKELGDTTVYSRESYGRILSEIHETDAIYTGAFQKPGGKFGYRAPHMNHLCVLESFMDNGLPEVLATADNMADVFEFITGFPGMGEFNSYQLLLNLSYIDLRGNEVEGGRMGGWSGMDFVVSGPGAKSGLNKLFGASFQRAKAKFAQLNKTAGSEDFVDLEGEIMRWLALNQASELDRLGLLASFPGLGPKRLPMMLADIEHSICEVDKLARKTHPKLEGKSKELSRGFKLEDPQRRVLDREPTLPYSWDDPARNVVQVRPGPLDLEKRYTIAKISKQRLNEEGTEKEYLVHWLLYNEKSASWVERDILEQDAPLALECFEKHGKYLDEAVQASLTD